MELGAVDERHADAPPLGGDVRRLVETCSTSAWPAISGCAHGGQRLVDRQLGLVGNRHRPHRARLAQPERERPRVDVVQRDQPVPREPVARPAAEPSHQHRAGVQALRLEAGVVDAVVPDHRGRERDRAARHS